jgi:hypothetical protein
LGSLDVDVDPLMIAGGVGESIDAVLIDRYPLRDAEFLTDGVNGLLDGRNDSHGVRRCHTGYTERADLAAAEVALPRSRACAQSSSLITDSPANVLGPASRWPPSIAMVSPVR